MQQCRHLQKQSTPGNLAVVTLMLQTISQPAGRLLQDQAPRPRTRYFLSFDHRKQCIWSGPYFSTLRCRASYEPWYSKKLRHGKRMFHLILCLLPSWLTGALIPQHNIARTSRARTAARRLQDLQHIETYPGYAQPLRYPISARTGLCSA